MFIYNVTINIDRDVEDEWKLWMGNHHIKDVMATGKFYDSKFLKLITEQPDAEGTTYAIQYHAKTLADIEEYLEKDASPLQKAHSDKFMDKFVAFRTVLEEV